MTDRAEIERLLNMTGRTLEGLQTEDQMFDDPKYQEKIDKYFKARSAVSYDWPHTFGLYQSQMIELLVGALQDSEPKRKYGECHHFKNGTYSCPITQMDGTLIRYSNFCDECGRDLRPVVREMYRREK